jgi:hypothetical protein
MSAVQLASIQVTAAAVRREARARLTATLADTAYRMLLA